MLEFPCIFMDGFSSAKIKKILLKLRNDEGKFFIFVSGFLE